MEFIVLPLCIIWKFTHRRANGGGKVMPLGERQYVVTECVGKRSGKGNLRTLRKEQTIYLGVFHGNSDGLNISLGNSRSQMD